MNVTVTLEDVENILKAVWNEQEAQHLARKEGALQFGRKMQEAIQLTLKTQELGGDQGQGQGQESGQAEGDQPQRSSKRKK